MEVLLTQRDALDQNLSNRYKNEPAWLPKVTILPSTRWWMEIRVKVLLMVDNFTSVQVGDKFEKPPEFSGGFFNPPKIQDRSYCEK